MRIGDGYFLFDAMPEQQLQVLDIGGDLGIVWQSTDAYARDFKGTVGFVDQFAFWRHLRPAKRLRDFVQTRIDSVEQTSPSVGVHHRNTVIECVTRSLIPHGAV